MASLSDDERAWWVRRDVAEEDPLAHEKLIAVTRHIEVNQDRKRDLLLFGAMYAGGIPPAGGGMAVDSYIRTTPGDNAAISLNVSRSVCDAVVSRVFAKSVPHLTYTTDGADYEAQHHAEQLDRGVAGVFYQEKGHEHFVECGRRAVVFGTGFTRIRPDFDQRRVSIEDWQPWERIVDDGESMYDLPRCDYTKRYYDRFYVEHMVRGGAWGVPQEWRETRADLVARLKGEVDEDAEFGYQQVAFRICVWEAWHRPSGEGANDGRHVLCVRNTVLVDEKWDGGPKRRPWQFATYRWSRPIVGFYGQGLVEIGAPIASQITKLVREIAKGQHLIKGHWLVEQGSKVVTAHINNDLSTILKYAGSKPEFVAPAIIAPEVYAHLWKLVSTYYELSGINQQTAQAQKPAGLDSGEAQRVYADQQTETLIDKGKRFNEYVKECGQLVTDASRELGKNGAYEVRSPSDDGGYETIDWNKLEDPDGFELSVAPTSELPGSPSAKIQLGYDLLKLGDIDQQDLLEIIGFQDLLKVTRRKQASRKLVEKKIGEMLREGTVWHPTPLLNLQEAVAIARDECNEAERRGVPDERLQLVRDFIDEAIKLKPPPMPAPGAGAGLPGAPPPNPMLGPGATAPGPAMPGQPVPQAA